MKKLLSTTLAAGVFAAMSITPVLAAVEAGTLPQQWMGGGHTNSNVDITSGANNHGGNDMNVKIQGGQGSVGQAYWDSFNVGSQSKVNFEFSGHNQTALNQVLGSNVSEIYGQITNSSCPGCGQDFAGTGKVLLINPNGVLFGSGANVNLNSFTVSNMNAVYDQGSKTLKLTKDAEHTGRGIEVSDKATIHGDKGVTFATDDQVLLYKGSKISTGLGNNGNSQDLAENGEINSGYGRAKIITSDGVNFVYFNNGGVKEMQVDAKSVSADKMTISLEGEIEAGNIDIRNYSTNNASELSVNGAVLKATKASHGADGSILLTASNTVRVNDSTFKTSNAAGAEGRTEGGNVKIQSGNRTNVGANIDATGDVVIYSTNGLAQFAGGTITAGKNVNVTSDKNLASIVTDKGDGKNVKSNVTAQNVNIKGGARADVQATLTARENINIEGGAVNFDNSSLTAAGKISAKSTSGDIASAGSTYTNMNGSKVEMDSAKDINVKFNGVDNEEKGLVAKAQNNLSIDTEGKLSISSLWADQGDMTLKSDGLIAGKDYVQDGWKIPSDQSGNRSFLYVLNGKFRSEDRNGNENYDVTLSDSPTDNNTKNARHHIQDKQGVNKFVLINKRDRAADEPGPDIGPSTIISADTSQSQYLNKLPRQPEVFNNKTVVNNGRTNLVDVFAAASQIEIEDDEEE